MLLFIQIIGIVGFILSVVSNKYPNTKEHKLLEFSSAFLFSIQFYLLEAMVAAFVQLINSFRALSSLKNNSFKIIILFLTIYWGFGLFFYQEMKDLLPLISTTVGTVAMFKLHGFYYRIASIFTNAMWIFISIIDFSLGYILVCGLGLLIQIFYILKENNISNFEFSFKK
tara:strand:- start:7270 stop:7779 length:510 start_codon:yes stop_codon:yes gene_type:complete